MRGLLRKDFYLMKTAIRTYLVLLLVFSVLSISGIYTPSIINVVLPMMAVLIPVNTFAYDEQAGWDQYAAATPSGRQGMVRDRYLFVLCLILFGMLLAGIFQAALVLLRHEDGMEATVLSGVATVGATGGLMNAVLLPLIYKFGVQKSRLLLMVVIAVTVGLIIGLAGALDDLMGLGSAGTQTLPILLAAPLGLLALFPSALISQGICRKKDY